ncbi:MAG: Pr6Pr family membrane protein [Methylocella sp.]
MPSGLEGKMRLGTMPPSGLARIAAAVLAVLAWFGVIVQLSLNIHHAVSENLSVAASLVRFFSFFTIETNMLVALVLTLSALRPQSDQMLLRPSARAGLVVYIIIVGVVYAVLLRNLWNPQGLQLLADGVLHGAMPILYPVYWAACTPKRRLRWSDPALWLVFPILYLIYILLRGAAFGIYPYPFIDVTKLGYAHVGLNALFLLVAFFGLGLIVTAIDHALGGYQGRRRSQLGSAAKF